MELTEQKKYFDFIQVFRGVAALMVVIHHASGSFLFYHDLHSPILSFIGSAGKYGVDFFFVLSGFIITYSSYKYKGEIKQVNRYLINRIVRIYIPYWPIGILMLILYWQFAQYSNAERSFSLTTSIFLLPDGLPALSVAWTLIHEILFYFVFIIFFYSEVAWNIFIGLWTIIIFYFYFNDANSLNAWFFLIKSPHNLQFIIGFLLAYGLKKGIKVSYLLSVISTIGFFLGFVFLLYTKISIGFFANNAVFSLGALFLINTAVCYWNKPINHANIFMILGNATYSIYLVHNPIQGALIRLMPKSSGSNTLLIFEIIVVLFACCSIGFIYYLIFEKNASKWIKDKIIT